MKPLASGRPTYVESNISRKPTTDDGAEIAPFFLSLRLATLDPAAFGLAQTRQYGLTVG